MQILIEDMKEKKCKKKIGERARYVTKRREREKRCMRRKLIRD